MYVIIIMITLNSFSIFTDGWRKKTNRALCTNMCINSEELAELKQNKSSLVKLST